MGTKEIDFGFLVARFMKFYTYNLEQVLETPIDTFWFLLRQITRIQAENDLRILSIHAAIAGGKEGVEERQQSLIDELGKVASGVNTTFDVDGWEALKDM